MKYCLNGNTERTLYVNSKHNAINFAANFITLWWENSSMWLLNQLKLACMSYEYNLHLEYKKRERCLLHFYTNEPIWCHPKQDQCLIHTVPLTYCSHQSYHRARLYYWYLVWQRPATGPLGRTFCRQVCAIHCKYKRPQRNKKYCKRIIVPKIYYIFVVEYIWAYADTWGPIY